VSVLVVTTCGAMTSLQDFGRFGWQRHGVSSSGAMDRLALATANVLVGNPPETAGIEFMLLGGAFTLAGNSARVAIAGAPCAVTLDGNPAPHTASLTLRDGQTLAIGPMQAGVFVYMAVAGGFALPPQLGSLSLHPRARISGFEGRALQGGDRLPLHRVEAQRQAELMLDPIPLEPDAAIRVVLGPQDDYFSEAGRRAFLSSSYAVSQEADRMGYRLSGPRITHALGYNIVSDGIVAGSVQVPGSGEPIVMMADRQTTGGYPKIATVISSDLRVLAQRRPGAPVRFAALDNGEAARLARGRARVLSSLSSRTRPAAGRLLPNEELFAQNLAGAAVDALGRDE
jgi:5-oxoprolinase (ATP-hydrolysing) subunit C